MILSLIAVVVLIVFSTLIFYHYYVKITFEKWLQKSNPKYPLPIGVRTEIILMLKGLLSATLCPALTLHLMGREKLQGYCGVGEYGWKYLIITFFLIWLLTDFFEFFYHRLGHTIDVCWNIHKSHHQFFNPTPFAVIADEYLDQFVRALPLIILPALMPINMDLLFFQVENSFLERQTNEFFYFSLQHFFMVMVFIFIGVMNYPIRMLIIQ
jgi:lathosterol oxidase